MACFGASMQRVAPRVTTKSALPQPQAAATAPVRRRASCAAGAPLALRRCTRSRAAGREAVVEDRQQQLDEYQQLLQLADEKTFTVPPGEEHGSDARVAALLEGEALLQRAVAARPADMLPRVMLLRNLMLQDEGREADVPALALAALQELSALGDDISFGPSFVPAMQIVLLGLKALYKLGQEAAIPRFLADAAARVPSMASDFDHLADRVVRQLLGGGAPLKAEMLSSHRWLSCIDLQAVDGRHHKGSPGLESVDLF